MPNNDHGERIARMEGIISQTLPRIEKYMEQGVIMRLEGNEQLSGLKAAIVDLKDYQESCDKERREIRTKSITTDNRLTSLEGTRRRAIAICIGVGGLAGWLTSGGGKAAAKMVDFFNA